jgi:hypothetical protein
MVKVPSELVDAPSLVPEIVTCAPDSGVFDPRAVTVPVTVALPCA